MSLSGSGYSPGTSVQVFLMPAGTSLGLFTTSSSGVVTASVVLPAGVTAGSGALQLNGAASVGGLLSVSVGVSMVPALAPVYLANGSLPSAPAGSAGSSVSISISATGQPSTVRTTTTATGGIAATSGPSRMTMQPVTGSGQPIDLGSSGRLIVENGQFLRASGQQMQPESQVALWVLGSSSRMRATSGSAQFLGMVYVDAKGAYTARLPLPEGLVAGEYTLQTNGTTRAKSRMSISLGMEVVDAGSTPSAGSGSGRGKVKKAVARVYFERLSSDLSTSSKRTLRTLVRSIDGTPSRSIVIGYVQGSGTGANDVSLSRQRAMAVASYLRSVGLDGRIVTKGQGVLNVPSDQARQVKVTVSYRS